MNVNELLSSQNTLDLPAYEKEQRRRILSSIIIITLVAAAIFGFINIFFYVSNDPAIIFFLVSILCLPTLWLCRREHFTLSGILISILVFYMAHYNLVDGAGIRDPGVVAYPIIILVGGLLFGKRSIPIFTVMGIVSLIIVVWLDETLVADLDRLIIISVLLMVGSVATRAVLQKTENDINQLKDSEENLRQALDQSREHSRRINGIIETVPEGVLLLDEEYQIRLANKTAKKFLDVLSPHHNKGNRLRQLGNIPIETFINEARDGWQELAVEDPQKIFEAAVCSVQKATVPSQNWVLVIRDVTLERNQQELIREQDRLATVGQLASGIAHDFRNILSIISTYSQIVQKRPQISKRNEYLNVIQDQIKDAVRLIEQILDFGRRTIMQRQALDVAMLIEDVIIMLKRTLPSSIVIEFIHESGNDVVNADKSRLQQVLLNLALNARDAMPGGGALIFQLRNSDPPHGLAANSALAQRDWLTIQVSDTGDGIHPNDLPHIFEPFYTTKEAGKGTGLGLAQVYGIVKQHKGEITVESQVNKGATFTLFLPTVSVKPEVSAVMGNIDQTIGRTIQVLLVEDNPLTRESTEEMLDMLGCQVITAENGLKAIELFRDNRNLIDLVISDIVMPGMGGVELYRELQYIAPEIKFLVITGYPLNHQSRQLLEQGLIDWIQKPFLAEDLSQKITRMII
jgi:two-component system cell cycle sensor histidine kinase/response regulator CckA